MPDPVSLAQAVDEALLAAPPRASDVAGSALVRAYAQAIDDNPGLLDELGPKLLAALTAMGLTPAGRAQKGGAADGPAQSGASAALDELRARRAKRAG